MTPAFDRASTMDIPRAPRPRRRARTFAAAVAGIAALTAVTVALARLRNAAPPVDRASVWIDEVKRGPMSRAVNGRGALVPEDIRWLSALSSGRVERIRVRPGASVAADTVLLDLANPDVELAALEAERQVAQAGADLANLRASLQNQRLAQQSLVATTESDLADARRRASADGELEQRGFLSAIESAQSRDKAAALTGKVSVEQQRLGAQVRGISAQLAAQEAQIARLRAIADFRRRAVEALHVRAGSEGVLQELPLQVGQSVAAGALLAKVADPRRLKAQVRIPETQAKDVRIGQAATIDTHNGVIAGRVSRVDPAVTAGTVTVDVALTGALPEGARPDLGIDGTVELERLADVVFVGRPATAQPNVTSSLFVVDDDGAGAHRAPVTLGRLSTQTIEVVRGLQPGQRVILSDMSQWEHVERVQLR